MTTYYLDRAGGAWEGRWFCEDEGRTYRRTWESVSACEKWCARNGFRLVVVTDGFTKLNFN